MADDHNSTLGDAESFRILLHNLSDLQSTACDIGIERQSTESCIFNEERAKLCCDNNKEESLEIIKQTTDTARLAMNLIVNGLQVCVLYASQKSKLCSSLSSAIAYFREQKGLYQAPIHLLVQWERNIILIDLFTNDKGLYCNKRIAQDMFDICMETFDWLRSLANNNK
jgi:hypothetical protein